MKKLDQMTSYSLAHFTLLLLLYYLVKCRSRSLHSYWVAHASAHNIIVRQQNH